MSLETKKAICRWCNSRCRVRVFVENGHLDHVEEDPDFPMAVWPPLKACQWRLAAKEWFYHPQRINFPLKRAGERGEAKWQQISWEQALDEIAAKLAQIRESYGAEAIAHTEGTGRTSEEFRSRFFNLLGSPNVTGAAQICHGPRAMVCKAIMGWWAYIGVNPSTQLTVLWGRAPENSWARIWYAVRKSKEQGGKLIVVDPRATESASLADIHLQLRPGTDCALAMAMLHVIIGENLYDHDFVSKWCYGFDQLKERVQDCTPAKMSEITWVPENKIIEAARMLARHKPAAILEGMGVEHLENNAEFLLARYAISALTGNIGIEGGETLSGAHPQLVPENIIEGYALLKPAQKRKQIGGDQHRLFGWPGYDMLLDEVKKVWPNGCGVHFAETGTHPSLLWQAITDGKPYPVRALVTSNNNPMVTLPNVKHVYQALKKLDFYLAIDFWKTPSAELADYILPAASWMERPCLFTACGNTNYVYAGERALPTSIPGDYDHRDEFFLWRELGIRLGQKKDWPWQTWEEVYDYRLKPMNMTFKEFMAKGGKDYPPVDFKIHEKKGFATPTGKVELFSTVLQKLGYDPLPKYREPSETPYSQPELAKTYPLILITGGRHRPFYHSEHRQIESLRRRHPFPLVQIHPETAAKYGIKEGDWVWIETLRGRCRQKCQLFSGINPGVVHAQHGWWFPELPGEEPWLHGVWESNINVCTNDDPAVANPILGSWPLRTALCKVYKAVEYK